MKVVIQCAARKNSNAGYWHDVQGRKLCFVAVPDLAPKEAGIAYAKPDDGAEAGTWRAELNSYNCRRGNSFDLLPAWQLYRNPVYSALVKRFGVENVLILSAGWGLLRADFLTPYYDITFSTSAEKWKRRRKKDVYADFNQLSNDSLDELVFFGGKDYLPLFCDLTKDYKGKRRVFFRSKEIPEAPDCTLERFVTTTRTNWHYECAWKFLS
tara:strand:- start:267 stop:899 length:633 start_codon:yes stop_codon:yes gene_type:complete